MQNVIDHQAVTSTAVTRPAQTSSRKKRGVLPPLSPRDFDRVGKWGSYLNIALEGVWSNRVRSMLTTLGIFIGVSAVVAVLILTQGVSASITNSLSSLGTNQITISPGTINSNGVASGTYETLTAADATAVSKLSHVTADSPIISVNEQVVFSNQNWSTRIEGVSISLQTIQNWSIAEGAWFSVADNQHSTPVVVIGQTIKQKLFDPQGVDPIGKTMRIGKQLYRVVGVLASKGSSSGPGASSQDDVIFVPFTTGHERLRNTTYIDQILVQIDDSNNTQTLEQEITTLLEQRHRITQGSSNDFALSSSQQLQQTAQQFSTILTYLLVGIASISLTVGGIGIMNIMIASVTERIREIGIRIAIGAQRQDIRNQFLLEALILTMLGGLFGLIIGLLIGYGITLVFGLPFVITVITLTLPFAISAAIWVAFGLFPAIQASRLDPIEALRSL